MKKIVEKYSRIGALNTGDVEITPVKSNDNITHRLMVYNKNEVLLSDVKEGDVICVIDGGERAICMYTDKRSAIVYNTGSRVATFTRSFIDMWAKGSNIICYVAEDYKQALGWLSKEESNN